jgi:hypothetical protein
MILLKAANLMPSLNHEIAKREPLKFPRLFQLIPWAQQTIQGTIRQLEGALGGGR